MKHLKVYKASAGSGKTFRLAVEYIMLLVGDPTAYQRILAVTFTNKATAEMKERIVSQLYGIANGLESSQDYVEKIVELTGKGVEHIRRQCATALRNIVHDYSRFNIVTIDSFFQSIVRELANELGLSARLKVEVKYDTVLRQAVDEMIDNLNTESPEYDSLVRFIKSRFDEEKSWKIEETVAEFGKNLLNETYLINDSEVRRQVSDKATLDAFRGRVSKHLAKESERLNNELMAMSRVGLEAIQQSGCEKAFMKKVVDIFGKDWTEQKEWKDTFDKYISRENDWLKKAHASNEGLNAFIDTVLIPRLMEIRRLFELRTKVEVDASAALQHLYNLMILGKISEQMSQMNKDEDRVLLGETAHFLRDVINANNLPFIYEKTGTRIDHVMIDEFQDTSAMQWDNFKPLLQECLDKGNDCLIVGDVKQSIYRFRNSDWQTLNDIEKPTSDMYEHVAPIEHDINHRSSPEVVRFNNEFFEKAIEWLTVECPYRNALDMEALRIAYAKMRQKTTDEEWYGYVKVINQSHSPNSPTPSLNAPLNPPNWGEEKLPLSMGTSVIPPVGRIEEGLPSPQLGGLRGAILDLLAAGVHQNDIAILVRTGKQAAEICQYFEDNKDEVGVNIVSGEAFRLDASPAVMMVIFALRSLTAMNDRLHLATLAYHYQTMVLGNETVKNDISLPLMARGEDLDRYLPEAFLAERNELRYKPIAEIAERVYTMFGLERIEGQGAYMFFFHDVIQAYSQDNLADIDSFLKAWDDELHEKTMPNATADGIRMMTMHKSKGLEFHTVIIPFCNQIMEPKDSRVMWTTPSPDPIPHWDVESLPLLPITYSKAKNGIAFKDDQQREALLTLVDSLNLLYVAFTRAKHNLVVITDNKRQLSNKDKDKLNANELIVETLRKMGHDVALEESDSYKEVIFGKIVDHDCTGIKKKKKPVDKKPNPLTRKFDAKTLDFVSVDSMAQFRQSNESDIFVSSNTDSKKAQAHANRIRLISLGNLYHAVMQELRTIDDLHPAVMRMDMRGCFQQLADRNETEATIRQLIESVSQAHPEWFSPEWTPITERTIQYIDNGKCVTKRPDRVVVKGDTAIVIDYKTAVEAAIRLPDGSVTVPSENKQQVIKYCDLMRELGFKHVQGYLWYLLDDIVYQL